MKKIFSKLTIIICAILLIYMPSVDNYFSSDDWFHLNISQISSIKEFTNFFSFTANPNSAAFYRPLSTQVFFFTFQKIFGINPLPFHLFVLLIFSLNLFLIYRFTQKIFKNNQLSILSTFLYGISVSNFTRLYFLSAFQEILLVFFSLLTLIFYLKKYSLTNILLANLFFIGALLSKETAAILPLLLLITLWHQKRFHLQKFILPILILIPYLFLRLFSFGLASGDSYQWSFSVFKIANTLFWYILWSIGAPESLVDYVDSGLQIVPKFFSDFGYWSYIIIFLTLINLILITILIIRTANLNLKFKILYSILFFFISLLPVIFMPWHKFSLELGLPLIGFCLLLSIIITAQKKLGLITLCFFITLNLSMHYVTYQRHYSVNRAKIAKKITHYFLNKYPKPPESIYFEFINDSENYGKDWGASKQISHITSNSNLFQVIYKNPEMKVFFEDISEERPVNKEKIKISTKQFFQ